MSRPTKDTEPDILGQIAVALTERGVGFDVGGGGACAFTWLEIDDEPALCIGVGDDGVLIWNVVQQGEMVEDGEIVEGSAEAVAEWVVERARAMGG
ncbi:MAG: hypothetical protein HZB39_18560 [Planctomycetes bacterium]|nr:hypothetical protein [Planctomycetota bacterium]